MINEKYQDLFSSKQKSSLQQKSSLLDFFKITNIPPLKKVNISTYEDNLSNLLSVKEIQISLATSPTKINNISKANDMAKILIKEMNSENFDLNLSYSKLILNNESMTPNFPEFDIDQLYSEQLPLPCSFFQEFNLDFINKMQNNLNAEARV